MGKYTSFDKMITPIFVKICFWIGMLVIIIGSLGTIGFGLLSSNGNMLMVIGGLATLFLGPVIIRIYCELLIVTFKMQEALTVLRDLELEKKKNRHIKHPVKTEESVKKEDKD